MSLYLLKKWTYGVTIGMATSAVAQEPSPAVVVTGNVTGDVVTVVEGPAAPGTRALTNVDLIIDADLDRLVGWTGALLKLHGLSNNGGRPNDLAGTLQGVNNIEVDQGRTKLYEAYIEQSLLAGRASVLVGLADLNADFYQNDSAGLLIAPGFGIGTELAATGPNGPSIFPSTSPAVRISLTPNPDYYLKAAIFNADAGVIGDPGGVDLSMREGALVIGEVGWTGRGKVSLGYWRYTKLQDDTRQTMADGTPVRERAQGAYLLIDQPLTAPMAAGPAVSMFGRAGVTDGTTTPYSGGFQVGVLLQKVLPGRPDSQISFGMTHAKLSRRYRDNAADAGTSLASFEQGFEITFSDQLAPWLRFQPDLQYVRNPGGDPTAPAAVVLGMRFALSADRSFGRGGN